MSRTMTDSPSVLACVTNIVSAHLSNNAVPVAEVPAFIRSVQAALSEIETNGALWSNQSVASQQRGFFYLSDSQPLGPNHNSAISDQDRQPAVPVEESVQPGYIVCLEDGRRLRMLKRYLKTQFGMTPEDYRARWNLPSNYPMAAPEVIDQRRTHAKAAGLGRKAANVLGGQAMSDQ